MAKSKPVPPPPLDRRAVLAMALIIAGVVFGVPLVVVVSHPNPPPAPTHLERTLAALQGQDPLDRHQDVEAKIAELTALTEDPAFAKLPPDRQERIRARLRELTAYQTYEKQVAAVPDPAETRSLEQLQLIQTRLLQITVPPEYQLEWSQTEAGRRHDALRREALTLDGAVHDVRSSYQKLVDAGRDVIRNAALPNLPGRARAVLDQAQKLPTPQTPGTIPGSNRLTYATVFRFAEVVDVYDRQWPAVAEQLRPLVRSP